MINININGIPIFISEKIVELGNNLNAIDKKNTTSFFIYTDPVTGKLERYVWQFIPRIKGYDNISANYSSIDVFGSPQQFYAYTGNQNRSMTIETYFACASRQTNYEWVQEQIKFLQSLCISQYSRLNPNIDKVYPPPIVRLFHGIKYVDIPVLFQSLSIEEDENSVLESHDSLLPSVYNVTIECIVLYQEGRVPGGLDYKNFISEETFEKKITRLKFRMK